MTRPQSTTDVPAIGMDFFPTILELAGLPLMPKQHLDGVSLVPVLKGGKLKPRDLFWHYPHYGNQGGDPSSIIRSGDWKLIHYYEDGHDELYHLTADIGEQHDCAAAQPERTKAMRKKLDVWLTETHARIPQSDARFNAEQKKKKLNWIREKQMPSREKQAAEYLDPNWKPNANWWSSQKDDS
jgi:arylsulfatase A-like enzyme